MSDDVLTLLILTLTPDRCLTGSQGLHLLTDGCGPAVAIRGAAKNYSVQIWNDIELPVCIVVMLDPGGPYSDNLAPTCARVC